jgi:hypothetical protein
MRKTLSMYNKSSSARMPSWWPSNLETLSRKGNYHNLDTFSRSLQLTELAHTVACLILHRNAQVGSAKVRHKQAPSSNCNQEAKLDTGSQSWPTTDESLQSPEENTHASTSASEYITISNEKSQMKTKSEPDTHKLEHIMRFMRANATGNELQTEVDCYMSNLEPRRLKSSVPVWWSERLDFYDLQARRLGKDGKHCNSMFCLAAYNNQTLSMLQLAFYLTMETRCLMTSRTRSVGLKRFKKYGRGIKVTASLRIHGKLNIHQHQVTQGSMPGRNRQ